MRISIPSIGVRARVGRLGLNRDRSLEVPRIWANTGWWSGGPAPGQPGPAVIAGHVDSYTGPAVFSRLRELRPGDLIRVVRADGSVVRFAVRKRQNYSKRRFPTKKVYGSRRYAALRLITCDGSFDQARRTYNRNLVVYAGRERAGERGRRRA